MLNESVKMDSQSVVFFKPFKNIQHPTFVAGFLIV